MKAKTLAVVMCCYPVIYLCTIDVWKFTGRGDGTPARSISWKTVAMDTDNTVGGNTATQWRCHWGHL